MYKWTVRILNREKDVTTVEYDVITGPGSVDDPVIGNTPREAAINFFQRIKDFPENGGWDQNEVIDIAVSWLRTDEPAQKTGEFRNYPNDKQYIEV